MKKIALFIGLFFYLLAASGATLHLHFCQGEPQALSLSEDQTAHSCPLCAKSDKNQQHCHQEGSCKDIRIAAQKVDDFNRLSQTLNFNSFSPAVIIRHWMISYFQFAAEEDSSLLQVASFGNFIQKDNQPVFILNQNFRI